MARVLVPIAEGNEEIEAVTVIDLLRRAEIEVVVAGQGEGEVITLSRGVRIVPDTSLAAVAEDTFDMVVIPGGAPGAERLGGDPVLRELLQRHAKAGRYTCAICAGPTVLARAGLLSGRRATSFPGALEALELPDTEITERPVEADDTILTSRGPGTAMDFALELIERLSGRERRDTVEERLQRP